MARATSVLGIGFVSIILVGFLGAYHSRHPVRQPKPETVEDYHEIISQKLMNNINAENIRKNLHHFTSKPHPAGTKGNYDVAQKIAELWNANGLADVHFVTYDVLLSYPNYKQPNHVSLIDEDGEIIFTTKGVSPAIIEDEQADKEAGIQWIAYSGNGTVEGEVVYCHHGNREDFEYLQLMGIDLKGKIAMLRYGEGFRGDKVINAEQFGAIGAILFSDPAEVARDGIQKEDVYPRTEWMPNEGVQRGTVMIGNGDPLTPLYPSKKDLYRSRTLGEAISSGTIPSIPVLPLSYSDAMMIMSHVDGKEVPEAWRGGMNVTYRLGPFMRDHEQIRLTVHSSYQIRKIKNVVGYIYGSEDRDRYVILGNHYDAWVYGSIDPNSGTAVLAEVARAMVQTMNETSWRPARTMLFCNWDAEEYGLIGSNEFVEEFASILNQRAVVYLNVDNIHSNQSLHVSTVPTLYQVVTDVSKRVPNPVKAEVERGRKTVYDTWIATFPNEIPFLPDAPRLPIPGSGSDHAPFLNYLGIPVVDFTYKNATSYDNYPLYHSLYETPFTNEHIFDIDNLAVHRAVGQYWAELAREFTDFAVLPIKVVDLASALVRMYIPDLKLAIEHITTETQLIIDARRQLRNLIVRAQEFLRSTRRLDLSINKALQQFAQNPFDSRTVSLINNRIIGVERCFVNPRGISGEPDARHILFSTSKTNRYAAKVFAPIYTAMAKFVKAQSKSEREIAARSIAIEISNVQYAIMCATNTISSYI